MGFSRRPSSSLALFGLFILTAESRWKMYRTYFRQAIPTFGSVSYVYSQSHPHGRAFCSQDRFSTRLLKAYTDRVGWCRTSPSLTATVTLPFRTALPCPVSLSFLSLLRSVPSRVLYVCLMWLSPTEISVRTLRYLKVRYTHLSLLDFSLHPSSRASVRLCFSGPVSPCRASYRHYPLRGCRTTVQGG